MEDSFKYKIKNRQMANKEILRILEAYIDAYPEQRFGQILSNYILPEGDPFFEESVDTLNRLKTIDQNQ